MACNTGARTLVYAYAYDIDGNGVLDLEYDIAAYYVITTNVGFTSMGSDHLQRGDGEWFSFEVRNYRHVYVVNSQG